MTELCDLDALEARRLIGSKQISPVELLESCIARIEAVDPALNAMVTRCFERGREEARAAEESVRVGELLGLLHGLPLAIKDLNQTQGVRTTFGSLIYEQHVPEADESVVAAMRGEGAILVGKANTPEFGAGANTRNRVFGVTGNPFDPQLTCAGSSGGSAVAVATGMAPIASGSDYGGSLRTPAAFCGVVGFRPSPGLVPNEMRPVALTPFPVQGPMARSVGDVALLLRAMIAEDKRDPYSGLLDPGLFDPLGSLDLGTLRVGFSEDLGGAPLEQGIRRVFRERSASLARFFGQSGDCAPDLGSFHDAFEILRGVYFVAAHKERVERHREIMGPSVIDNVERGLQFSAADIAWAHLEQTRLYRRFLALFDEIDLLICPAASVSPFPHERLYVEEIDGEPMPTYMRWLAITYGITLTSSPVVCLPCGRDEKGLPFGIQVVGPNGADRLVLEAAHGLEQAMADDERLARPLPDIDSLASRGT